MSNSAFTKTGASTIYSCSVNGNINSNLAGMRPGFGGIVPENRRLCYSSQSQVDR
jgi:hypothetical protein